MKKNITFNLLIVLLIQAGFTVDIELNHYAMINSKMVNESSGIIQSRNFKNTYWTHNDSGDSARIFAITKQGNLISPKWSKRKYNGLSIVDAHNIDWEDIANDNKGNLYIGAFGNNGNARRDLCIYELSEPNPQEILKTRSLNRYSFSYPDQKVFPPKHRNFDAEGFFKVNDSFYIFTKNRTDKKTKAYQLNNPKANNNVLKLLGEFDCKGLVTAADISWDGKYFVLLTYTSIHIFEFDETNIFSKHILDFNFKFTKQIEGICFEENNTLLISNENKKLYSIDWLKYLKE
jgi:hypothetical protein